MKPMGVQFYLDRARECRDAAASSPLQNVQRKHNEAEARWRTMADLASMRENERIGK